MSVCEWRAVLCLPDRCVTVCYSVLPCVTVCYCVLPCVTIVLQCFTMCYSVLQFVIMCTDWQSAYVVHMIVYLHWEGLAAHAKLVYVGLGHMCVVCVSVCFQSDICSSA